MFWTGNELTYTEVEQPVLQRFLKLTLLKRLALPPRESSESGPKTLGGGLCPFQVDFTWGSRALQLPLRRHGSGEKDGRSCGSPTDGVVPPTSEIPCHFAAPSKGSAPLPCMSLRAHIDWVALEGHAPNRRSRSRKSFGNGGRTPTLCPTPAKFSSDPFDALQSTAGLDLAA